MSNVALLKRGPLSPEERELIQKNYLAVSAEDIAKMLARNPDSIKKWIAENAEILSEEAAGEVAADANVISQERQLIRSPEWQAIKQEFLEAELKRFRTKYREYMEQFGDDTTPTEKTQILQLIKYELLMSRCLVEAKSSIAEIARLEETIREIHLSFPTLVGRPPEIQKNLNTADAQLLGMREGRKSASREISELTKNIEKILESLKGTRDQRIKEINRAEGSLLDVLRNLQKEEHQKRMTRQMETLRVLNQKEKERLTPLHTYRDGTVDSPILNSETVVASLPKRGSSTYTPLPLSGDEGAELVQSDT